MVCEVDEVVWTILTWDLLKKKATKRYRDVLRTLVSGENPFPLMIRIKLPSPTAPLTELRSAYEIIRSQSVEQLDFGYSIEWQRVQTRNYSANDIAKRLNPIVSVCRVKPQNFSGRVQ